MDNVPLLQKILDLQQSSFALVEENHDLRVRVRDLEEALRRRESLTFREGYCWREGDPIPFCPKCFEGDGKAVHLQGADEYKRCLQCGSQWNRPTTARLVRS
jgi:hypothetical protein